MNKLGKVVPGRGSRNRISKGVEVYSSILCLGIPRMSV